MRDTANIDRLQLAADVLRQLELPDDCQVIVGQDVRLSIFAGSRESFKTVHGWIDEREPYEPTLSDDDTYRAPVIKGKLSRVPVWLWAPEDMAADDSEAA